MRSPRLAAQTPAIGPASGPADRPFWSVMIPSYEPGDLLGESLRSVLAQDEGPGRMQIAVVDDASPGVDVAALVRRIAGGRVEYHRNPANLGLAGNWNRAIGLARGRWVHLLHQDDLIHPGFYARMAAADAAGPDVGAAFCRHAFIDAEGRPTHVSEPERDGAGRLDDALARMSRNQVVQCPSIVVRRAAYESLGGFRDDLKYSLDWEMWTRIAAAWAIWYEPETLASYRTHPDNESARLRRSGAVVDDMFRAIEIMRDRSPGPFRNGIGRDALHWLRDVSLMDASHLLGAGQVAPALDRVRLACRCDPGFRWSRGWIRYHYWAGKVRMGRLLGIRSAAPPS